MILSPTSRLLLVVIVLTLLLLGFGMLAFGGANAQALSGY